MKINIKKYIHIHKVINTQNLNFIPSERNGHIIQGINFH